VKKLSILLVSFTFSAIVMVACSGGTTSDLDDSSSLVNDEITSAIHTEVSDEAGRAVISLNSGRQLDVDVRDEATGGVVPDITITAVEISNDVVLWTDTADGQYLSSVQLLSDQNQNDSVQRALPATYVLWSLVRFAAGAVAANSAFHFLTDPSSFERVIVNDAVEERCVVGNINNAIDVIGASGTIRAPAVFIGIRSIPGPLRGVHVINNHDMTRDKWISEIAKEALIDVYADLSQELNQEHRICWPTVRDEPLPILYMSIPTELRPGFELVSVNVADILPLSTVSPFSISWRGNPTFPLTVSTNTPNGFFPDIARLEERLNPLPMTLQCGDQPSNNTIEFFFVDDRGVEAQIAHTFICGEASPIPGITEPGL